MSDGQLSYEGAKHQSCVGRYCILQFHRAELIQHFVCFLYESQPHVHHQYVKTWTYSTCVVTPLTSDSSGRAEFSSYWDEPFGFSELEVRDYVRVTTSSQRQHYQVKFMAAILSCKVVVFCFGLIAQLWRLSNTLT